MSLPELLKQHFRPQALKQVAEAKDRYRPLRLEELRIRNKQGDIVPLNPNEVQSYYMDLICPKWREGIILPPQGLRDNILKFRQPGFSTLIEGLFYIWASSIRNYRAWIVAADDDGALLLWQIIETYYDHDPRGLPTKYKSEGRIRFAGLNSEIRVWSSNKLTLGRGTTLSAIHMSEIAWWQRMKVRGGLLQAVPMNSGVVIEETTANGYNAYRDKYYADKRGETDTRAHFFPWKMFGEYEREVSADFVPTKEEQHLMDSHNLTPRKIMWRRAKKKELDTSETPFTQEYPLTDQEAYISSGNHFFDTRKAADRNDELQSEQYDPLDDLVFEGDGELGTRLRNAYQTGEFKVWQVPQSGYHYVIGADPAGGVNTDGKRDYCSLDVYCVETGTQVAQLYGRWTPDIFGLLIAAIGWMFNTALVGVLSNNHGHATCSTLLREAKYPPRRSGVFGGVYYYDPAQVKEQGKPTQANVRTPGWPENTFTKPFMLDIYRRYLNDDTFTLMSRQSISEVLTYVELPGGQTGADTGSHDDTVSSGAVAAVMFMLWWRTFSRETEEDADDTDEDGRTGWGGNPRSKR